MENGSRYVIGIDLGTTNSVASYIDMDRDRNPRLAIQTFQIPQLTREGVVEPLGALPSYCYLAATEEV